MVVKKFLAGIAALLCATSVHAVQIPLTTTIFTHGHHVAGAGNAYEFDVNDLLADWGLERGAIASGQLTVFGSSAAAYNFAGTQTDAMNKAGGSWRTKPGVCNNGRCEVEDESWVISSTKRYTDNITDTMWVQAGDTSSSDSTKWQQSYTNYGNAAYTGYTGSQRDGWDYFYTSSRTYYGSYSGDLIVSLSLDSKALGELLRDGVLSLQVWASQGQFDINSLSLSLSVDDAPAPPAALVPVPTTILLTGLGLAALATMRRRGKA